MHAQIEVEDLAAVVKGNESNIMSEESHDQAKQEAPALTSLNNQSNGAQPQRQQQQQNKGGDQNKMNRNKNKNNNNNKFVKKPPHMQNQQQQQHNGFQHNGNKFNKPKNNNNMGGMMGGHGQQNSQHQFMAHMANAIPAHERKFTGRCRLFVGNLPAEMTEAEFKEMFVKYGEIGEVFINTQRSFGFIKLDTRINAEHARQELDGYTVKGRCLRVRFASHGAAVKIKNLSPHVSNEYLESAFAQFGPVERAVVMVDDKGKPTGEGLVEFERKSSAQQCISRCTEHPFILTHYPRPVVVESYEQVDDEDGLPEKSMTKNPQFYAERETLPRFAKPGSFEFEVAQKWHEFYEQEKQINEEARQKIEQAKEMLEYEIEQRLVDYKASMLKEDLQRKQEELLRLEEMRKGDFQRRKEQMDQFRYLLTFDLVKCL